MKFTDEMGSVALKCIPSLIRIDLGIQKLIWGIHTPTESMVIL
jgi:hypothetical protein